jgi:hypothetical protein
MPMGWIVASAVLLVGAVCLLDLLATPFQRVSRARLEKFARRQCLQVSIDNGPVVIRYLATTRRWRGSGLLVGATATVFWPLFVQWFWPDDAPNHLGVNGLALFAGWFAGAVVAEWRVSTAAAGRRRAAVLEPRRLADYVPRPSRVVPVAAWVVLAAFELFALVFVLARHGDRLAPVLGWIALTAVAGTLLAVVGRQVLVRPQRYRAADQIAADDAIRSRSLHVLAGSALAIAGYLSVGVAETLATHSAAWSENLAVLIAVIGGILVPIVGFNVATAPTPPIRRRMPLLEGRPA